MEQADNPSEIQLIINAIKKGKYITLFSITIFVCLSSIVIFNSTREYRAEALLIVKEKTNPLAQVSSQAGALASLAGIDIGTSSNKEQIALATLQSREFLIRFINQNNLKPDLFALRGWNRNTGQLIYDKLIYDNDAKAWNIDEAEIPTDLEAYEEMTAKLSISNSVATGIITVRISHPSPIIAAQLTNELIGKLDETLLNDELEELKASIKYLEAQANQTPISDMKQVFYQLIQEQLRKLMLANATNEYLLKTIDPAFPPEKPHSPRIAVLLFGSLIIGIVIGISISVIRYYTSANSNHRLIK